MTADNEPATERPRESAYAYALKLLAMRSYSIRDMHRKLERRGYPAEEVSSAVEELRAAGLLDDVRFAEQYARSRIANDAASPRRVVQLLFRFGITRTIAEEAVQRVMHDEALDPRVNAELLARKKAAGIADVEPAILRKRLYGYLARRGFALSDIRAVVDPLVKERGESAR
jgi:regulatory protein